MEELANKRARRIVNWFKEDKDRIILGIIIICVIAIRIHYFFLTKNQPLWWDEADYMNIAKSWAGIVDWKYSPIRPVLLPLLSAGVLFFGMGEGALRIAVLTSSVLSILLMYGIGRMLFDKRAGLISAFMVGVFWSISFYSNRILTDVPVMFLWLAAIYFFFKGYSEKQSLWLSAVGGVFLTLSFLMKYSSITLIAIFLIYSLATEKLNILKNKKMWAFWGASFLSVIPFFVWQIIAFGKPLAFMTSATAGEKSRPFIESLVNQTMFSVSLMHSFLIWIFLAGVVFALLEIVLMYDSLFKKSSSTNKLFFVIIWLALSLVFFGWLNYGSYMDERYYFVFYPAIFLVGARALSGAWNYLEKYNKMIGALVVIALLIGIAYQNIPHADSTIKVKIESFSQVKSAGEWVKQNSAKEEISIVSEELAELTYYTERKLYQANNLTEMSEFIEKYNPKYIVIPLYYASGYPEMLKMIEYVFQNNNKFKIVQMYGPAVDKEGKIPIVSIFEIVSDKEIV